jgi:alkanesulfonate monooxygenase SsuD/methylene tetrahydromethanopterin reductase-like flavin-dependent oxidoreductase (luciferase family)
MLLAGVPASAARLRNCEPPAAALASRARLKRTMLASSVASRASVRILPQSCRHQSRTPEQQARQIADAFALFGPPERCAERLLQAREEAGVEQVFLFPAHDLARAYEMPEAVSQTSFDI